MAEGLAPLLAGAGTPGNGLMPQLRESAPVCQLELAVHSGEQRGDGRAHLLVGEENDYRDRGH